MRCNLVRTFEACELRGALRWYRAAEQCGRWRHTESSVALRATLACIDVEKRRNNLEMQKSEWHSCNGDRDGILSHRLPVVASAQTGQRNLTQSELRNWIHSNQIGTFS